MISINNFIYIILILNYLFQIVENSELKNLKRKQRALSFPSSSTIGIFIALAVPLDLPNRNVFMSYNFEANYNLPYEGNHYIPGPLQKFIPAEDLEREAGRENDIDFNEVIASTNKTSSRKKRKSLSLIISRKSIYEILKKKLKSSGLPGKNCLLKIICEINSWRISQPNGVLGSIFHIIFTPSSSTDEKLPKEYYIAEMNGLNTNCKRYFKKCPHSTLDLISINENI